MAQKIRLHKGLSRKEVVTIAEQTLVSGGVKPLQPGDVMPDGTIYAGKSPDKRKPMYTTPADAPQPMDFRAAESYARDLKDHGHSDWRLPSKAELKVLYKNRAAIGGFADTDYWSSTTWGGRPDLGIWRHDFARGEPKRTITFKTHSLRCVR